jgi:hypothetical protein
MSDQNRTFLDDIREGKLDTLQDNVPWDEYEVVPMPSTYPMWMGLYGQTIVVGGGKDTDVMLHTHDSVEEARDCWRDKLAKVRDMVQRHNHLANMPPEIRELLEKLANSPGVDVQSFMVPANGDQAEQYAIGREAKTAPRIGFYL